jgi:2-keto-3-deoxy-L-rhamnonate aldolase RhmA
MKNLLKQKLAAGATTAGVFIADTRDVFVVRLAANAGLDFIFLDMEHGPLGLETTSTLCQFARAVGVTPLVRVASPTYEIMCPLLDAGAQGVILPRMRTAEDVREAVECCLYPPAGRRGIISAKGYCDYRRMDLAETLAQANSEIMILPQVELVEALDCLDDFLDVPGISGVLIGPSDLSISMGIPGDVDNPQEVAAIQRVIDGCRRRNLARAIAIFPHERLVRWRDAGINMLVAGSETYALIDAFKRIRELAPKS